jgi:hypothetical protein
MIRWWKFVEERQGVAVASVIPCRTGAKVAELGSNVDAFVLHYTRPQPFHVWLLGSPSQNLVLLRRRHACRTSLT